MIILRQKQFGFVGDTLWEMKDLGRGLSIRNYRRNKVGHKAQIELDNELLNEARSKKNAALEIAGSVTSVRGDKNPSVERMRKEYLEDALRHRNWEIVAQESLDKATKGLNTSYKSTALEAIKDTWRSGNAGKAAILIPTAIAGTGLAAGGYYGYKALKNRRDKKKAQTLEAGNGETYIVGE